MSIICVSIVRGKKLIGSGLVRAVSLGTRSRSQEGM